MEIINPVDALTPYIKHFIVIESGEIMTNRRLPDTGAYMSFRYKGEVMYLGDDQLTRLPAVAVTGIRNSPRMINYSPRSGNIIVQFKDAGASPFFDQPFNELFGYTYPLADLVDRQQFSDLEERFLTAQDSLSRILIIQQFLLSRLRTPGPDLLVTKALDQLRRSNGLTVIRSLASDLNISQDLFEKRFRKIVGSTPKQYAAIVRMKNLISQGGQGQKRIEMALDAGYFDQAHFNKAFKSFTGQTPGEFFQSPYFW